ncbi:cysteine desulfurase family protein [Sphingomonas oryzagri]|uniref:Cysteine desulfurase n=1 Tax=Sphingomonas oryzagri TaxID=3042314 RepID=A0ABT6N566_9SPHN|nr:cysteine desulfurase family protein [Sphingomonas oryzagri]MDH7640250.1 cysteine desulfurase family protein [Sphingomonas oryzagri]
MQTDAAIYLDGFATTPLAPEALAAMQAAWADPVNAGSPHRGGARATALLDAARKQIGDLVGADAREIIFTSGATEANNLAIRGLAGWAVQGGSPRRRIIVSAVEHKAVSEAAISLKGDGFEVVVAPVTRDGVVDLDKLRSLIDAHTLLVSVMMVNNETGVIQPVQEVASLAHRAGALMHCDAAQAVGKIAVDVSALDIDYLSVSSHKMYGPVGVGALYVASDVPEPKPLFFGGGQERGIRSGTVPVPLVAGFACAARLAASCTRADYARIAKLEREMLTGLERKGVAFEIVSSDADRVAGAFNVLLKDAVADDIVDRVSAQISISTGSACTTGQVLPSHVLMAMGLDVETARSAIRIAIGRYNSSEDITLAVSVLADKLTSAQQPTGRARQ